MYRRLLGGSILVVLVTGLCIWSVWPPIDKIKLGLDLKGGTLLVYKLDVSHIDVRDQAGVADEVKKVIYSRLDRYGLKEIEVRRVGPDRVQVAIPSVSPDEIRDLKDQVGKAGKLTLHLCVDKSTTPPTDEKVKEIRAQWDAYVRDIEAWNARVAQSGLQAAGERPKEPMQIACVEYKKDDKTGERIIDLKSGEPIALRWYVLHNEPDLKIEGSYIQSASRTIDPESQENAVSFAFRGSGAQKLSTISREHLKEQLAIVVDDVVLSAPVIRAHLSEGKGIITGRFKEAEARGLANILSVGSLPTNPTLMQEQTIGARLGKDSIASGQFSVIMGFTLVIAFMIMYYRGLGIVADIALLINLLLVLAYVAMFRQSLSFPGIAGLLLTVGMSVDANILIFERMREEFRKEKGVDQAVAAGFDRAFWAIFDSNLTTFITGLVLFKVGTGPIQGFAITLMAGLVANFVTAIYMSRLMISVFYRLGLLRKFAMGEIKALKEPKFGFIANQRYFITGSAIVLTVGMIFVIWRGKESVGIDFRGGTEVSVTLEKALKIEDFKARLAAITDDGEKLFEDAQVQASLGTPEGTYRGFLVRVPYTEATEKSRRQQREEHQKKLLEGAVPATTPAIGLPPPSVSPAPAPTTPVPTTPTPTTPVPTTPVPTTPAPTTPAPEAPKTGESATTTSGTSAVPEPQPPVSSVPQPQPPAATPELPTGVQKPEDRYRLAIEKTFAAELAPVAFPVAKDEGTLNPEVRVAILQVNYYTGGSPRKADFAQELKKLLDRYLIAEEEASAKEASLPGATKSTPRRAPVGKFTIADVKLLETSGSGAFSTYEIMTAPIKFGDPGVPASADQTLTRLRQFFSSDFYRKQALFPEHNASYGQFFVSEPIPSVSFVDSAVAADFQGSAMMAVLVSFLAVLFYLGIRFELTYGIGAVVAVLHDVVVGVIVLVLVDFLFGAFFSVKIDLQVIAGLLTLIGFSLNDTIVIFDRIRENMARDRKAVLEELVNTSINQTLSRTVLTTFTVLITVVVLLIWGGESARSFTTCMLAGIISGTYSTVFIASPVMIYLRRRKERRHEERVRVATEAHQHTA